MKKTLFLIFLVTIMTGCATDVSSMSKAEQQLQWIKDADPQLDASKALESGDFRLMGLAQRSVIIPGVPLDRMSQYELKCGVKIMEGVSDTVLNNEHLKLMQQAHKYALQYNAIIKTRCEP